MPPTLTNSSELWGHCSMPSVIDIDCLLPNSMLLNIQCFRETTLNELRNLIWQEAKAYPYYENLKQSDNYVFVSVTQEAKSTEYYDYSKRICDLKLFHLFFKLVEIKGDLEEKLIDSDIGKTIGLYINEIEQIKDNELIEFRFELFKLIKATLNNQKTLIESVYTPYLEIDPSFLEVSLTSTLNSFNLFSFSNIENEPKIQMDIFVMETNQPEAVYNINVTFSWTPEAIIIEIIKVKLKTLGQNEEQIKEIIKKYKDSYLLNICGCDEIIFGNVNKISSYKYIKNCLSRGKKPSFHLISIDKLKSKLPKENKKLIIQIETSLETQQDNLNALDSNQSKSIADLSWNSKETFSFYLDTLGYLPMVKDCDKLFFKIAVYHGQELVTDTMNTDRIDFEKMGRDASIKLNLNIHLDINIKNLHRCAKLCICLYSIPKRKKEEFVSVGCITLNLFDYKGCLVNGKKTLYLWPTTQNSFLNICLSDATGQNPNKDFTILNVEFMRNKNLNQIIYPNKDQIKSFIYRASDNSQDDCFDVSYALENDNNLLESIFNKDSLAELTEQDKSVLWRRREDCLDYAHSLPKLLQSVKWSNKEDIIEIYNLLYKWPDIKPIVAIELLHSIHADIEIRNFAIKCLDRNMKDEEVQRYLLQLVQCLKNEPFYDNSLTRFLLNRAFKSQRIGYDLFWLLKSEMSNLKYRYRFGLILEAYCRGIGSQIKDLLKQVEVVEKLSILAQEIKNNPDNIALIKSAFMQETLNKTDYVETLSNFISPLNRSHLLGNINFTKSKILTSAKRPLYLSWTNRSDYSNLYESSFELIFKHGDDLRQDMLTLQILKLMDIIWKSEGLDLKMIVYDCLTTGNKTGFIEVIKDALTLFKIQMEGGIKGRYQIDAFQLFKWLNDYNDTNEKLELAIDTFTRSCAGYCVATFILGIGDRHPDNIMVNKEGRLFHIDFGHFLGHFKKKYGVKRERVPFVLTEDFIKVISRGAQNPLETAEFHSFQNICEQAYMIIRRYSNLIINLFTLMLSSDMPELQSIDDIMYLRKTLAIDETDENALKYFRKQFIDAYKFSFTTKFDWMFHALNKKNQI